MKKVLRYILVAILSIILLFFTTLRLGTKLESTSVYSPQADISWIQARIAHDTKGMDAEEILDYAENETCKHMTFEMHGNRVSNGNCVDYANTCGAICNDAFQLNGINAHAVRSKGAIKVLGCDARKAVSKALRSGGNIRMATFFADHDFVTVTMPDGSSISTDPSISDVLGINLRKYFKE